MDTVDHLENTTHAGMKSEPNKKSWSCLDTLSPLHCLFTVYVVNWLLISKKCTVRLVS